MRRTVRLRDGAELRLTRDEPGTARFEKRNWVSCRYEVTIMWPTGGIIHEGRDFGVGWAFGGDSWSECFGKLRSELAEHGRPTARVDEQGRLVLGYAEAAFRLRRQNQVKE